MCQQRFPYLTPVAPPKTVEWPTRHHHRTDCLTLPGIDPESFFTGPDAWNKQSVALRTLARANMTLVCI